MINEICAHRITAAIRERDDMWHRHESAQISFLQNENSQMLTGLHAEIERLHHHLRGCDKIHSNVSYYKNELGRVKLEKALIIRCSLFLQCRMSTTLHSDFTRYTKLW